MKRLLFTHSADIDGMGNAILAKLAFDDIDIIYARNVRDLEPKFLREYDSGNLYNYDFIYITDLSIKTELAQRIANDEKLASKLFIFDHHETAVASGLNDYSNGNVCVEIEGRKTCATELFYNYLIENKYLQRTQALDDFVKKVRLEDNWEWEKYDDLLAHDIAILFSDVGIESFVNIMVQLLFVEKNVVYLNENLTNRVKSKKEKIKIAIENSKRYVRKEIIDGIKTVICFINYEYRNDIAEYFKKNNDIDFDVIAMIALDNDQISIRALKENDYARKLAEKYGGGGHNTAAAIPLNNEHKEKIVNVLFNL